jgi:hypothetical protein
MYQLLPDGKACFITLVGEEFPEDEWDKFMTELFKQGLELASDEPVDTYYGHDYYLVKPIETDADDDGTAQPPVLQSGDHDAELRGAVALEPGTAPA